MSGSLTGDLTCAIGRSQSMHVCPSTPDSRKFRAGNSSIGEDNDMPYIATADGAEIFYKDWGHGQPVIFSHGWPLSSDAWDVEMKLVADNGFRAIAHDRRGHGRSTQT